jgi:nucleoside-diphosphate-sugar epimerase
VQQIRRRNETGSAFKVHRGRLALHCSHGSNVAESSIQLFQAARTHGFSTALQVIKALIAYCGQAGLNTGAKRNIDHLLDHHRFEVIRHDVTFPLYIEVDQIYNLACPASPIRYRHDPVQTTKTSVHGAINMLRCQALAGQALAGEDPPGINLGSLW